MKIIYAVAGLSFAVGTVTGKFWFEYSAPTITASSTASTNTGNSPPLEDLPAPTKNSPAEPEKSSTSLATPKKTLTASEMLTAYPPPHISDPDFFGPNTNAAEISEARRENMDEFLESMQHGGVSAEVIEQMRRSYEDAIAENRAIDMGTYNSTVIATYEQQSADLENSLRSAGWSEEMIANSLEVFRSTPETQPVTTSRSAAPLEHPDVHQQQ